MSHGVTAQPIRKEVYSAIANQKEESSTIFVYLQNIENFPHNLWPLFDPKYYNVLSVGSKIKLWGIDIL